MTESLIDVDSGIKITWARRGGRSPWYHFTVCHALPGDLSVALEQLRGLRTLFAECKIAEGQLQVLLTDNYLSKRKRERGHETAVKLAMKNIRIAICEHRQAVKANIPAQRQALSLSPQGATI